jgi:hypothetical protein
MKSLPKSKTDVRKSLFSNWQKYFQTGAVFKNDDVKKNKYVKNDFNLTFLYSLSGKICSLNIKNKSL